jgi:hypothetical protein
MQQVTEMQQQLAPARDQIIAAILKHEGEAHGGGPCWGNRASAVAYIAHALGMGVCGAEGWQYTGTLLAWYDRHCVQSDCTHPQAGELPPPAGNDLPPAEEAQR